jgi:CheY-like chemotaxis protein
MPRSSLNVEDPLIIRMMFQRLCMENSLCGLAIRERKGDFPTLTEDGQRISFEMPLKDIQEWGLQAGESVELKLKDRKVRYEAISSHLGPGKLEGLETCLLAMPRILRRADGHRLVDLVPEGAQKCTFTNERNSLLDGTIQGLSEDGLEIVLRDPRQGIQNILRMGEESLLDVTLDNGLRIEAPTTVAYFHENAVGLKFTKTADAKLLDQYCTWIQEQQTIQAQRDREEFQPGGITQPVVRANQAAVLPQLKVWVDRDPMILLLSEKTDFSQRLSEALSRKYGFASLDYIKGPIATQLSRIGGSGSETSATWGRTRLIMVHNLLRLSSSLEVIRQLTEKEKCPLPVLSLGTAEDEDKKRNHAIAMGAVDFLAVEPFRVLATLKKLDEVMSLFEG